MSDSSSPTEPRTYVEANASSDDSVILLPSPEASRPITVANRMGGDDDSSAGCMPEQRNAEIITTPQSTNPAASAIDEERSDTHEPIRRRTGNQEEGDEPEDSNLPPADLAPAFDVARTKRANKAVDLTGDDIESDDFDQDSFHTQGGSVTPTGNQTGDEGEGESTFFASFANAEQRNRSEPLAATAAVDLTGEETQNDVNTGGQAAASTDKDSNNEELQAAINADDVGPTLLPKMASMLPPLQPGEYDTLLPTTPRGILIKIKHCLQLGTTSFNGYSRLEDNTKGPAELQDLCGNIGDRVIAVDGASVLDTPGPDIIKALIAKGKNKYVHLRFRGTPPQSSAVTSVNSNEGERDPAQGVEGALGARVAVLPVAVSLTATEGKTTAGIRKKETQPVGPAIPSPTKPPSPTKENQSWLVEMKDVRPPKASTEMFVVNSARVEHTKSIDDSLGQMASQPSSRIPLEDSGSDDSEKALSREFGSKISSGNETEKASAPHETGLFKTPTSAEFSLLHSIVADLPSLAFGEYDSRLPVTSHGIMIKVKQTGGMTTFEGYKRYPNGLRGPSELQNLCRNIGDRLIAIDGISVLENTNARIMEVLMDKSKNNNVEIRFRPKELLSATSTPVSSAKFAPIKDLPILATKTAGDADQKEKSKEKTAAAAGSPVQLMPPKREELRGSPEALAMLAVLQNESGVTLTSPLPRPRIIDLTHENSDRLKPRAIEERSAPTVNAPRHSLALLPPPVRYLYNSTATLESRCSTEDFPLTPAALASSSHDNVSTDTSDKKHATPMRPLAPAASSRIQSKKISASKRVVASNNVAPSKRQRLHASKLTGNKIHMLQAKWSNDYAERELESTIAVTYAMQLDNLKQQEQARKLLAEDNQRYRRAQERKKPSSTTHRGKHPPPVARTAATAKRRKQTKKRPLFVNPDNDDERGANDTVWTPLSSGGRGSTGSSKNQVASTRQPPTMVYEGPPLNNVSDVKSWPSGWESTGRWPDGWMMRVFERKGGATKGSTDRYWYSPTQKKLRSMLAVKRFVAALDVCEGDEEKAWILMREKK